MGNIGQFIHNNLLLCSIAVIVLILIFIVELLDKSKKIKTASPNLVAMLSHRKGTQLIDIRDQQSFDQGHISNSKHMPIDQINKTLKVSEKTKSQPIIVICQRGISANRAAAHIQKMGFNEVYVLKGGIQAWSKDNMPLVKS